MVVGKDFQPVVDPAQNKLGGENVGHGAIVERHVHLAVVLDVVVVGAKEPRVAEALQARDFVGARADRGRPDRLARFARGAGPARASFAFDALQVQRSG